MYNCSFLSGKGVSLIFQGCSQNFSKELHHLTPIVLSFFIPDGTSTMVIAGGYRLPLSKYPPAFTSFFAPPPDLGHSHPCHSKDLTLATPLISSNVLVRHFSCVFKFSMPILNKFQLRNMLYLFVIFSFS